jgi:site-specific recombinase XerD
MAQKRQAPGSLEILELCRNFLYSLQYIDTVSTQTVRSYRSDLSQAFALESKELEADTWSGAPTSDRLNEAETDWLLGQCRSAQTAWKDLSPASRNRKSACLKSFLNWLLDRGVIERDLSAQIHSPKVPIRLPHHLSVDEALALLSSVRNELKAPNHLDDPNLRRDLALILLLYGGGLRVSEACGLEWSRLDESMRTARVLGKGGKERIVIFPPLTVSALTRLPRNGRFIFGEEPLSTRVAYDIVKNRGSRAGLLKPLHPHALRHSFATHLLSSGANLRTLQELLGHSTLQATQRYTHIGVDQLARTMEAFHPLGEAASRAGKKNKVPES